MLNIARILAQKLADRPYRWAAINGMFGHQDAVALAAHFPVDHFKNVVGHDGEKGYEYRARALIHLGAATPSYVEELSAEWRELAADLLLPEYRDAITKITGIDLSTALLEVNVTQYGPGAYLGPHVDLPEKLVTHVMYFNRRWRREEGGSLSILRSSDPTDLEFEVAPLAGNSVILVRSQRSWHMVPAIRSGKRQAVNVIFHAPGATSSMWPNAGRQRVSGWRYLMRIKQRLASRL